MEAFPAITWLRSEVRYLTFSIFHSSSASRPSACIISQARATRPVRSAPKSYRCSQSTEPPPLPYEE
jgi:hypothetical protein